jgi:hypothetical protein
MAGLPIRAMSDRAGLLGIFCFATFLLCRGRTFQLCAYKEQQRLLALDRNVRVLSPVEMSVYRREAVCREELCVCPESKSSRRDELLSGHTARYGGVVQTSCLPTIRKLVVADRAADGNGKSAAFY